jgi:hypothetical protein
LSSTLYFAYTARIAPQRLTELIPSAAFEFIAHLPETRMSFPIKDAGWDGGLPSIHHEEGNTVWGAVFSIPSKQLSDLHDAEAIEGRIPSQAFKAVDREGRSHPVVTHVHAETTGDHTPSRSYMEVVVAGARHWGLPTGWVAGLEEHLEDPLF